MSEASSPFRPGVQRALVGSTILAIFAIDALTPLGYGEWLLYVILLPLSAWSRRIRDTVVIALVCTVLVVAGFFLSPRGVDPTVALASRTSCASWLSNR